MLNPGCLGLGGGAPSLTVPTPSLLPLSPLARRSIAVRSPLHIWIHRPSFLLLLLPIPTPLTGCLLSQPARPPARPPYPSACWWPRGRIVGRPVGLASWVGLCRPEWRPLIWTTPPLFGRPPHMRTAPWPFPSPNLYVNNGASAAPSWTASQPTFITAM